MNGDDGNYCGVLLTDGVCWRICVKNWSLRTTISWTWKNIQDSVKCKVMKIITWSLWCSIRQKTFLPVKQFLSWKMNLLVGALLDRSLSALVPCDLFTIWSLHWSAVRRLLHLTATVNKDWNYWRKNIQICTWRCWSSWCRCWSPARDTRSLAYHCRWSPAQWTSHPSAPACTPATWLVHRPQFRPTPETWNNSISAILQSFICQSWALFVWFMAKTVDPECVDTRQTAFVASVVSGDINYSAAEYDG